MFYNYCSLFLYFFILSIIGYILEVIDVSIINKKISFNRGFLVGPYLPIYGIGSILMTILLSKYENDIIVLFIMGMTICSILEYITSYILEKIFNVRWWDYSNRKFNIDGRICIENGILFGLGGISVIKILNPFIFSISSNISDLTIIVLGIICSMLFFTDLVETLYIMSKLKINSTKYINKDATLEVRKQVIKELYKHNTLTARLLNSFPNINAKRKEYLDFNKLVFKVKDEIKVLKKEKKKLKQQKKKKLV